MEDSNSDQLSAHDHENDYPFANSWTLEQLKEFRHNSIIESAKHDHIINEFTCDECSFKHQCEFVYEAYNTNGDCLASK